MNYRELKELARRADRARTPEARPVRGVQRGGGVAGQASC